MAELVASKNDLGGDTSQFLEEMKRISDQGQIIKDLVLTLQRECDFYQEKIQNTNDIGNFIKKKYEEEIRNIDEIMESFDQIRQLVLRQREEVNELDNEVMAQLGGM